VLRPVVLARAELAACPFAVDLAASRRPLLDRALDPLDQRPADERPARRRSAPSQPFHQHSGAPPARPSDGPFVLTGRSLASDRDSSPRRDGSRRPRILSGKPASGMLSDRLRSARQANRFRNRQDAPRAALRARQTRRLASIVDPSRPPVCPLDRARSDRGAWATRRRARGMPGWGGDPGQGLAPCRRRRFNPRTLLFTDQVFRSHAT
jgi:hypothetical protein